MLKCADDSTKADMYSKLLHNDHGFAELLKSNYGHYVGITMVRTMPNAYKSTFFAHLQKYLFQYLVHQVSLLRHHSKRRKCSTDTCSSARLHRSSTR